MALEDAIANSVQTIASNVVTMIPSFIAAFLIFLIGWFVARVLSHIVSKFLDFVKLEKYLSQHHIANALGGIRVSTVISAVVKYYVMLIFLQSAVALISLGTLSQFMLYVLFAAPVFIGAVLLVVVAAVFGELVKVKVVETAPKASFLKFVGTGAKFLVVFFALVVALSTVGFNTSIITLSFVTLLQGVAYGVALAVGIAFGFGGQEDAKSTIKEVRKRFNLN